MINCFYLASLNKATGSNAYFHKQEFSKVTPNLNNAQLYTPEQVNNILKVNSKNIIVPVCAKHANSCAEYKALYTELIDFAVDNPLVTEWVAFLKNRENDGYAHWLTDTLSSVNLANARIFDYRSTQLHADEPVIFVPLQTVNGIKHKTLNTTHLLAREDGDRNYVNSRKEFPAQACVASFTGNHKTSSWLTRAQEGLNKVLVSILLRERSQI